VLEFDEMFKIEGCMTGVHKFVPSPAVMLCVRARAMASVCMRVIVWCTQPTNVQQALRYDFYQSVPVRISKVSFFDLLLFTEGDDVGVR
jgi:hypothetical protein